MWTGAWSGSETTCTRFRSAPASCRLQCTGLLPVLGLLLFIPHIFLLAYINHTMCGFVCDFSIQAYNILWSYSPLLLLFLTPFPFYLPWNFKKWILLWHFHICIQWTLVIFSHPHPLFSYSLLFPSPKQSPPLCSHPFVSLALPSTHERKHPVFIFLSLAYFA
jgi:hypothetical protein